MLKFEEYANSSKEQKFDVKMKRALMSMVRQVLKFSRRICKITINQYFSFCYAVQDKKMAKSVDMVWDYTSIPFLFATD
jgi:hypothetical protein